MHRPFMISSFLFLAVSFDSMIAQEAQKNSLFKPEKEWNSSLETEYDIVILNDDSIVFGEIKKLPELRYTFGRVVVPVNQAMVFLKNSESKNKWEVITRNNHRYFASIAEQELALIQPALDEEGGAFNRNIQVPLEKIEMIFLHPRKNENEIEQAAYQLELKNGDKLPVDFFGNEIPLKGHTALLTADIIQLAFNGGLQGTVVDPEKGAVSLDLCFAEDPYLSLQVMNRSDALRLPWHHVASLDLIPDPPLCLPPPTEPQVSDEESPEDSSNNTFAISEDYLSDEDEPNEETTAPSNPEEFLNEPEIVEPLTEVVFSEMLSESEEFFRVSEIDEVLAGTFYSEPQDEEFLEIAGAFEPDLIEQISIESPQETEFETKEEPSLMEVLEEMSPTVCIASSRGSRANVYVSRRKVTNEEYAQFVKSVGYKPPQHWVNGELPMGQEKNPVVNVTYKDSLLYTIWARKSLPTIEDLKNADMLANGLLDKQDGLDEWTCSIDRAEQQAFDTKGAVRSRAGEGASAYLIFGKDSSKRMYNGELNAQTGFRVISVDK